LLWVATWYLMATLLFGVPTNAARYSIYVMPALAILACRSVDLMPTREWRYAVYGVLACVALWRSLVAVQQDPLFVRGYREAAKQVLSETGKGTIMFAGKHDGNFIFHLRANDPERRRIVVRADKTLVTMTVHKYFGVQSHARTVEDVQQILDRFGVEWIVIERPDIVGVKEFDLLWQAAERLGFHLVREIPIQTNVPEYHGLRVVIFRRTRSTSEPSTVQIPVMGRDIEFRL
jgi:hypothetical protein